MDLRTSALLVTSTLALFTIAYFVYKLVVTPAADSGNLVRITQSCYRTKVTGSTNVYVYKVGFLFLSKKPIKNAEIKKVSAILGTSTADGKFDVTIMSTTPPTVDTYYVNAVCTIKKTLSIPELPGYSSPGSELTFSFRIEYVGSPSEQVDNIKIIPIDIEPC